MDGTTTASHSFERPLPRASLRERLRRHMRWRAKDTGHPFDEETAEMPATPPMAAAPPVQSFNDERAGRFDRAALLALLDDE